VGRDQGRQLLNISILSFNPRARVGRDKIKRAMVKSYGKFQSTRPRGARPRIICCISPRVGFNPRARVGRDGLTEKEIDTVAGFNPRARVGRDRAIVINPLIDRFNPRARVGRDKNMAL